MIEEDGRRYCTFNVGFGVFSIRTAHCIRVVGGLSTGTTGSSSCGCAEGTDGSNGVECAGGGGSANSVRTSVRAKQRRKIWDNLQILVEVQLNANHYRLTESPYTPCRCCPQDHS
jgi:hypothetical protein